MSKRRSSDRGAGESSGRPSKLLCPGISGNNAKRVGPFVLGPRLGNSPVQSIVQCLARKDGTDDFYQLKVSTFFRSCLHGCYLGGAQVVRRDRSPFISAPKFMSCDTL
ncbi:hypothetical protein cypCar_00017868 [Cyprinus carpio]|nr:hypothetical protein cypCar_00017868 [Cyprinus carpio]